MLWVNDDCCQQRDVRAQLATGPRHSSTGKPVTTVQADSKNYFKYQGSRLKF